MAEISTEAKVYRRGRHLPSVVVEKSDTSIVADENLKSSYVTIDQNFGGENFFLKDFSKNLIKK